MQQTASNPFATHLSLPFCYVTLCDNAVARVYASQQRYYERGILCLRQDCRAILGTDGVLYDTVLVVYSQQDIEEVLPILFLDIPGEWEIGGGN
jgi:hypothetical protein